MCACWGSLCLSLPSPMGVHFKKEKTKIVLEAGLVATRDRQTSYPVSVTYTRSTVLPQNQHWPLAHTHLGLPEPVEKEWSQMPVSLVAQNQGGNWLKN